MNIEIDMSGFDAALNEAMMIVAPETLEAANRESGEYLRDYLASWYDNKGREHWVNTSLPTHGPGRMSTGWFSNIARKWFLSSADSSGAVITNPDEDGSLRHKIRGGTITAKNAGALTIPLVPEAHGRRITNPKSGNCSLSPTKAPCLKPWKAAGCVRYMPCANLSHRTVAGCHPRQRRTGRGLRRQAHGRSRHFFRMTDIVFCR